MTSSWDRAVPKSPVSHTEGRAHPKIHPLHPQSPYPAGDLDLLGAAMEQVLEGHVEVPHDGGILPQGPPASGPPKGQQHLRAILGKELCVRGYRDSPSLRSQLGGPGRPSLPSSPTQNRPECFVSRSSLAPLIPVFNGNPKKGHRSSWGKLTAWTCISRPLPQPGLGEVRISPPSTRGI